MFRHTTLNAAEDEFQLVRGTVNMNAIEMVIDVFAHICVFLEGVRREGKPLAAVFLTCSLPYFSL